MSPIPIQLSIQIQISHSSRIRRTSSELGTYDRESPASNRYEGNQYKIAKKEAVENLKNAK